MGGLGATDRLLALARTAPGQTVLDIGCGVGMTACALAREHDLRVVGIDRQPGMVAWARRGGAIALNEGTWTRTPPPDVTVFVQQTMMTLYRRSPAFRRYIHDMRGARRMAQDLFKYYGYGLYVGRRAA